MWWDCFSCSLVFELQFALVYHYQTTQTLIQPAANIKNSLNSPGAPFCTTENSRRQQRNSIKEGHICSTCYLFVLTPCVQTPVRGTSSRLSHMLEESGGKCEMNDFSDTSCTQTGSVNLTLLITAVALSLGATTRLLIPQGSTVASALHRQAVL